MAHQEITQFINYLDSYKTVDATYMDINNLVYNINNDYYKNKYFLPFYVGDSKIYKLHSAKNEEIRNKKYIPAVLTKINIDVDIQKFSDLLTIIHNYEYKETEEYNIDLKSLIHIKDELQQIDQMIGMENLKTSILHQLIYFLQNLHINTNMNTKESSEFKHTVIYGPPGTGKTKLMS